MRIMKATRAKRSAESGSWRLGRVWLVSGCMLAWTASTPAQFRDVTPKQPTGDEERVEPVAESEAPVPQPMAAVATPPEKPAPQEALLPEPDVEEVVTASRPAAPPRAAEQQAALMEQWQRQMEAELVDDTELRPLRFRGLLVGETSYDEVRQRWGDPFKVVTGGDIQILKYRALPFRQVDVSIVNDRVASILIHLFDLQDPAHVAKELRMTKIEPVPIPDEYGNVMGLAFPERGVLLGFDLRDPESLVSKIQLEPLTAEPFLLRAEYDFERRYDQNLADLKRALQLKPDDARAYASTARLLLDVGRGKDALDAVERAIELDDTNSEYRVLRAAILAHSGKFMAALRQLERIIQPTDLPAHVQAEIELLRGDLLSQEIPGEFNDAMRHHLKAIELAVPLANHAEFVPRRSAKKTLILAHLAVARDISLGNFQRQAEVAPRWVRRAEALADEFIRRDQGDPAFHLLVAFHHLAVAADLRNPDDPGHIVDEAIALSHKQMAGDDDATSRHRWEWLLGMTLAEATRLQRVRGQFDDAIETANEALGLFQSSAPQRQSTPDQKFIIGRLYFHIGSLHAVHHQDHEEAVSWYHKAEPLLSVAAPSPLLNDLRTHGECFVSMGVSYWETGEQERAIELTEVGTDVLQKAVAEEWLPSEVLAIPYGNLAAMHKTAGHDKEAEAFAELAATLDASAVLR